MIVCLTCPPAISMVTNTKLWNDDHITIEPYNDAIRNVALMNGVVCLDTWACGINQNNAKDYTCGDGVHPNAAGAMLIANVIVNTIP